MPVEKEKVLEVSCNKLTSIIIFFCANMWNVQLIAYQSIKFLQARLKPSLDKIQLTLGLETETKYYDEFHGELLAEAAEGLGLNEDEYIP